MVNLLFLCHGNICRSPMAEYVFKKMLADKYCEHLAFVKSAATSTEELGNPVYPPARRILNAHGIDCSGHAARQIRSSEYKDYDLIICMDYNNIRNALRIFGSDPEHKLHLLSEYGHFDGEVDDPWYSGNFETVWDQINDACEGLMKTLQQENS